MRYMFRPEARPIATAASLGATWVGEEKDNPPVNKRAALPDAQFCLEYEHVMPYF